MRWDELFQDMESQLERARMSQVEQEAVETARAELARLSLLERLAAHRESTVRLRPAHGETLEGELVDEASSKLAESLLRRAEPLT